MLISLTPIQTWREIQNGQDQWRIDVEDRCVTYLHTSSSYTLCTLQTWDLRLHLPSRRTLTLAKSSDIFWVLQTKKNKKKGGGRSWCKICYTAPRGLWLMFEYPRDSKLSFLIYSQRSINTVISLDPRRRRIIIIKNLETCTSSINQNILFYFAPLPDQKISE